MIIILYIILIYILVGGAIYLIGQNQADKELTLFKQELFLLLGFLFKPIIIAILSVDNYIIPKIKQKLTIRWINKQYNKYLKNKDLTDEERKAIIHKRDTIIAFLNTVCESEPDDNEE